MYNGYTNRETWAFNLHWQNDQGMYRTTLEYATGLVVGEDETPRDVSDLEIGESVIAFWRDVLDSYEDGETTPPTAFRMFDREVGSWWRVDPKEVGEAVRESLDNEA